MPFHIYTHKVKDSETVCFRTLAEDDPNTGQKAGDRVMSGITRCLGFAMVGLGLPEISEKNIEEVIDRFAIYQMALGPLLLGPGGEEIWVNQEHLRSHIGLTINGTTTTRAAWLKKLVKTIATLGRQEMDASEQKLALADEISEMEE